MMMFILAFYLIVVGVLVTKYHTWAPKIVTEYFVLLPQIVFLTALFNILFRHLGITENIFYTSELLPFMYEGIIAAINGVRK